ncbi:MAG: hypothetical protein U1E27_13780, partial [Kiritimatiellia bacterium]|nr:hypothetical protein [Kiritimatiellia bacterium]
MKRVTIGRHFDGFLWRIAWVWVGAVSIAQGAVPAGVTMEFPDEPGRASLSEHPRQPATRDRLAFSLSADRPLLLKIRTAIFEVLPHRGYAVSFSSRPHGYYRADAAGILTLPLPSDYTYQTLVIAPADTTDLLTGSVWSGRADPAPGVTLQWGHEGGEFVFGEGDSVPVGVFSKDPMISRSGQPSFRLEKQTREGEVRYQSDPIRLEPGREYILSGFYHTDRSEFGSVATFGLSLRRQDGNPLPVQQVYLNPLIVPTQGDTWKYAFIRFTAPADAVDAVVRMGLRGTAGQKIWWDDLHLREAPPVLMAIARELPPEERAPIQTLEQVRERWRTRDPVRIEVTGPAGRPVLTADGRPIPPLVYNTYEVATSDSEIRPMSDAGIRWFFLRTNPLGKAWWIGPNRYDFDGLQDSIEQALQRHPEAVVMLSVRISPRFREWGEENPDGIWRATG